MDEFGPDILDLFGADTDKARTQAAALSAAMRRRRGASDLATIVGGPFAAAGKSFGADADQLQQGLMGVAQQRAAQDIQRQHFLTQSMQFAEQMKRHEAQMAETARHNRAGEGIQRQMVGGSLSPAAIDQATQLYLKTGQLPNLGARAIGAKTQILERAPVMSPGADIASNKAELHANQASLANQQKLLDLTKSWEATGKTNLGVLRGVAGQLVDSGSPLANKPLRWLYQNAAGDPTIAKFKAAHAAVVNEYAKILSGATGSAGVTDASRREAEGMIPQDATLAQINAAADILETDAGNRLGALSQGVEATRQRMRGGAAPQAAGAVRKFTRGPDGKLVEVK
jgi:hypothetical protein